MDKLDTYFSESVEEVKKLKRTPSDDEKLKLYGLFKQANIGDCNRDEPSMFNIQEKAKWKAWNSLKGMSKQSAKLGYYDLVTQLIKKYGKNT